MEVCHDHRAVVEDKPEVKKAGGVFYTPTYIVDYIVKNTVDNTRIHNKAILKARRKSLRNEATPAEQKLWDALQNSQLNGFKFRRQHSVGYYILDFYCPAERLAIEFDEIHILPTKRLSTTRKELPI